MQRGSRTTDQISIFKLSYLQGIMIDVTVTTTRTPSNLKGLKVGSYLYDAVVTSLGTVGCAFSCQSQSALA